MPSRARRDKRVAGQQRWCRVRGLRRGQPIRDSYRLRAGDPLNLAAADDPAVSQAVDRLSVVTEGDRTARAIHYRRDRGLVVDAVDSTGHHPTRVPQR